MPMALWAPTICVCWGLSSGGASRRRVMFRSAAACSMSAAGEGQVTDELRAGFLRARDHRTLIGDGADVCVRAAMYVTRSILRWSRCPSRAARST